jgi:hypothetical protein
MGLAAGLVGWLIITAAADYSGDAWRFFKPISLPSGQGEETLVEIIPDREVFAHALAGLADLRVIEGSTETEVQYKLLVERGERRRGSIGVTVRDLGHVPGDRTSFVADLGQQGVLHNEIEIRTSSRSFQRHVVMEGSQDAVTWAVLETEAQIFDFTISERNFTTRDTRVRYPPSTVRYLRISIIDDGEPPLEIAGAVVYFAQELAPQETAFAVSIISREEDSAESRTLTILDLGSQGLPSNRLVVATSQDNFYREVSLEGSNDAAIWTPVQRAAELYDYNTPRFVGRSLSISYPEVTFRYFRLIVTNEDNPPLSIDGVRAHGFLRKLIFSADAGSTYRLYYGNAEARAPSYELERLFPYLVTENLPEARLGAHSANPLFMEPAPPPKPVTERYSWLLPTVIAVAALLIGLFLASLMRQIRKVLPPPPS